MESLRQLKTTKDIKSYPCAERDFYKFIKSSLHKAHTGVITWAIPDRDITFKSHSSYANSTVCFVIDYDFESSFWTSGRYNQRNKQWIWTGSRKPVQNINFVRWGGGGPASPEKNTQRDFAISVTKYGNEWASTAVNPDQWGPAYYICEKTFDPTLFPK